MLKIFSCRIYSIKNSSQYCSHIRCGKSARINQENHYYLSEAEKYQTSNWLARNWYSISAVYFYFGLKDPSKLPICLFSYRVSCYTRIRLMWKLVEIPWNFIRCYLLLGTFLKVDKSFNFFFLFQWWSKGTRIHCDCWHAWSYLVDSQTNFKGLTWTLPARSGTPSTYCQTR